MSAGEATLAAAVNNYAICALYLRRIPEAVGCLESLLLEAPHRHLTGASPPCPCLRSRSLGIASRFSHRVSLCTRVRVRWACADPVVFNLCTLYDLSCSPDISVVKKKVPPFSPAHPVVVLPSLSLSLAQLTCFAMLPRSISVWTQVLQQFAAVYHMDDPVLHWRSFRLN